MNTPANPAPSAADNAPTPRTDAVIAQAKDYYDRHREPGDPPFDNAIPSIHDFARTIERELTEARATLLAREGELDELQRQLAEAGKDRERLETVIRWALGEVEDFPTWPDSVTIKGNPKFWWRTELRKRFDTARAGEGRP